MAQALFDALTAGVNSLDSPTVMAVQHLLDQQPALTESTQVMEEDEDLFQCGKCKKQFTALSTFLAHKNEACLSLGHVNLIHTHSTNENAPSVGYVTTSALSGNNMHGAPLPMYGTVQMSPLSHLNQNMVINDDMMSLNCIDHTLAPVSIATHATPVSAPTNYVSMATQLTPVSMHNNFTSMATQLTPITTATTNIVPQGPPPSYIMPRTSTQTVTIFSPVTTGSFMTQPSCGVNTIQLPQQIPLSSIDKLPIMANLMKPTMTKADRKASHNGLLSGTVTADPGSSKKKLTCQYCKKVFTKNFDLQQHVRSHTGERPFQCIVCGRAFAQKSNVKKHMSTHKVWPSGCGGTLPKQNGIDENNESQYIPESSPQSLQATEELSIGTTTDAGGQKHVVVDNSYLCQYCSMKFKTYYLLKSHMVSHKANQVYKCVLRMCGRTFKDLDAYLTHTKTHEQVMTYRCHMCNQNFTNLYDLGVHQISHSLYPPDSSSKPGGFRQYACIKCQNKYANPEALEHHLATSDHHFPCTFCNKVFPCERYLRRHLPIHGTTPKYQCDVCKKEFKTENYLKMHMVCHSSERPFTCDICSAAFNRRDKLKRHLLIHDAVKKFKCPFKALTGCTKEFNRADKLKAHIIIHSGIKPYVCKVCGRSFQRSTHLTEHERVHKADYDFKCEKCGKGFFREKLYRDHKCHARKDGGCRSYKPRTKRKVGRPRKRMITVTQEMIRDAKRRPRGRPRKVLPPDDGSNVVTVEVNIEKMSDDCVDLVKKDGPVIVVNGANATVVNGSDMQTNVRDITKDNGYGGSDHTGESLNCRKTDGDSPEEIVPHPEQKASFEPGNDGGNKPVDDVSNSNQGINEMPLLGGFAVNKPMDVLTSPQAYIVNLNDLTLGQDSDGLLSEPSSQIISSSLSQVLTINGSSVYPAFIVDGRGSIVSVVDSNGDTIPAQVVLTPSDVDGQYMAPMGDFGQDVH